MRWWPNSQGNASGNAIACGAASDAKRPGFELLIIIIIKKCWQCKAGRERLTSYQSEDPSPTIPTHRMKEKGKTVIDKKGASS